MNNREENNRLASIFLPRYLERVEQLKSSGNKLVHYTSASTALSILKHHEIWMRNTRCMNDFLEVKYGINLFKNLCRKPEFIQLKGAFGSQGKAFEVAMSQAIEEFDDWINTTYIACFSEHMSEENQYGRLSMWRGYGSDSSVAFVLKPDSFITENNFFDIYTSPVEYLDQNQFFELIKLLTTRISSEKAFLESLPVSLIIQWVKYMVQFAVVSIKHPGFKEEKEWRIIADLERCHGLKQDTIVVGGIPQLILKIPLSNDNENNNEGFSLEANLDHLIIGPTPYPAVIAKALSIELAKYGITYPMGKITVSDIPFRTHI